MKTFYQFYEEISMCEKCGISAKVKGLKYCKSCTKIMKDEMKNSGYLQNYVRHGSPAWGMEMRDRKALKTTDAHASFNKEED